MDKSLFLIRPKLNQEVFILLKHLKDPVDQGKFIQRFFPAGDLWRSSYGLGILCIKYYKPEHRINDMVISVSSLDDFSFSFHGKDIKDEPKVLEFIDDLRDGFPTIDVLKTESSKVGLYLNI